MKNCKNLLTRLRLPVLFFTLSFTTVNIRSLVVSLLPTFIYIIHTNFFFSFKIYNNFYNCHIMPVVSLQILDYLPCLVRAHCHDETLDRSFSNPRELLTNKLRRIPFSSQYARFL